MDNISDYVFTVPVCNKYLIHAPLHNITALVNRTALKSLKDKVLKDKNLYELYRSISDKPLHIPGPYKTSPDPDFIGLIPTRACNFKCLYCGFHSYKDSHVMDMKLAASSVEWMVNYVKNKHDYKVEVHFFGGEPFFAPDVVNVSVHRTRLLCAKYRLKPVFKVATNGFFDEELCSFIGDYFDTVVLSLDGPEEIQNKYRPLKNGRETSKTVERNAYLLGRSPAALTIRVCVTNETVEKLQDITHWLCRSFNPYSIDFEVLKPVWETEETGLLPPDPWVFAVNYIKSSFIARSYGVIPVYSPSSTDTIHHSFCPVGKDSFIVSPDGTISACYLQQEEWQKKGLNLTFGKIDGEGNVKIDKPALENIRRLTCGKNLCKKCIARWHCAGGCHISRFNSPEEYDDFCIQTRIITLCNLLYDLGCYEDIENFLSQRKNLEIMALCKSDLLDDRYEE